MSFSLIVTSINREFELKRLFVAINNQQGIKLEEIQIIFIDQGNNDHIVGFIDKRIEVDHIKVKMTSLSNARNIGIGFIKNGIVGFPDDDCWYNNNLLRDIERYFADNKNVGASCFRVMDPERNMSYGRRPENKIAKINYLNIFKYPTSAGLFLRNKYLQSGKFAFNEEFGVGAKYGANEDTEFIHQLVKAEVILYYVGKISIYHKVMDKIFVESEIEKSYKYGIGTGALMRHLYGDNVYAHTFTLLYSICSSIAGFIIYLLFNKIKSQVYIHRARGILKGLITKH